MELMFAMLVCVVLEILIGLVILSWTYFEVKFHEIPTGFVLLGCCEIALGLEVHTFLGYIRKTGLYEGGA